MKKIIIILIFCLFITTGCGTSTPSSTRNSTNSDINTSNTTINIDSSTNEKTSEGSQDVTYVVTFDSAGGAVVPTQEVKNGEKAQEPAWFPGLKIEVQEGIEIEYQFIGWYLEDKLFDFNEVITKNITLKAKWEKKGETIPRVL